MLIRLITVLTTLLLSHRTYGGEPVQPQAFHQAGITKTWESFRSRLTFGAGQTLALIDDGCTLSRPEWSQPGGNQPKILVTHDSVSGDSDPAHEGRGYHGTTIGIPSSLNYQGRWGVAYNNQLAVIRALECCHCKTTDSPTVAAGLQWVIDNYQQYRITTINLAPVDDQEHGAPVATAIDAKLRRLRKLGIWVSAPSGNHDYTKGISWPASQPHCFAIGATRPSADEIYLDRHPKVELLVPASATSSSNAIACGAAMIIREAMEITGYDWAVTADDLPHAIMKIMQSTGKPVTDPSTNITYRRLDLYAAVEHVFTHAPPRDAIRFSEHLIAGDYAYAYGITALDIDQDGDLDITSADYTPHNRMYLYQNSGTGNFTKHTIHQNDPSRLERHALGDIDGDGDQDMVVVKNLDGHLIWLENTEPDKPFNLWKRHLLTARLPGAYDVVLGDFDEDGHLDVSASSWIHGNQFSWFRNPGNPSSATWSKYSIETGLSETRTMRAADFDGDGDVDLLGTSRQDHQVIWYEKTLNANKTVSWTKHLVDDQSKFPVHGNPADVDGDGDMDIVMALGFYFKPGLKTTSASNQIQDNQIVWYENRVNSRSGLWKKHQIAPRFDDAFEAVSGDLDGDGDMDVVATSWRNPGRIAWFENRGDSNPRWVQHLLKTNWRSANQVLVADLNGDGRLDIAACAEHGSNELRWWRNEGP
ncbi:MAG: FG-GAP-like repeat-containing protein [Planctomycetota bacterium]|nr:FG-GAP-like repeat-containing protein [Planctomycetota bacterium]